MSHHLSDDCMEWTRAHNLATLATQSLTELLGSSLRELRGAAHMTA